MNSPPSLAGGGRGRGRGSRGAFESRALSNSRQQLALHREPSPYPLPHAAYGGWEGSEFILSLLLRVLLLRSRNNQDPSPWPPPLPLPIASSRATTVLRMGSGSIIGPMAIRWRLRPRCYASPASRATRRIFTISPAI